MSLTAIYYNKRNDFFFQSYTVRNSYLELIGDIVCVSSLSEEDFLDADICDDLLTDLFDHIIDVSEYVRIKCLQIWNYMIVKNCVPHKWNNRVLKMAADRFGDICLLVRIYAVKFVKTFMIINPMTTEVGIFYIMSI